MATVFVLSVLFSVIALGGGLAHVFALPNKINMPAAEYLVAQQVYSGWAFLGIAIIGALVLSLISAISVRHDRRAFRLRLGAAICIALGLVVFFIFTYPANLATDNWTMLPDNWRELRKQWEYSHAVGAGLNFIAVTLLVVSAVRRDTR